MGITLWTEHAPPSGWARRATTPTEGGSLVPVGYEKRPTTSYIGSPASDY
jgi:hypothetical protein